MTVAQRSRRVSRRGRSRRMTWFSRRTARGPRRRRGGRSACATGRPTTGSSPTGARGPGAMQRDRRTARSSVRSKEDRADARAESGLVRGTRPGAPRGRVARPNARDLGAPLDRAFQARDRVVACRVARRRAGTVGRAGTSASAPLMGSTGFGSLGRLRSATRRHRAPAAAWSNRATAAATKAGTTPRRPLLPAWARTSRRDCTRRRRGVDGIKADEVRRAPAAADRRAGRVDPRAGPLALDGAGRSGLDARVARHPPRSDGGPMARPRGAGRPGSRRRRSRPRPAPGRPSQGSRRCRRPPPGSRPSAPSPRPRVDEERRKVGAAAQPSTAQFDVPGARQPAAVPPGAAPRRPVGGRLAMVGARLHAGRELS
mgnify:CR=1 FL=1